MDTKIYKANPDNLSEYKDVFGFAADIIRNGGLVAFPTETVYGLGANALDKNAVKKIYEAKGRPQDNPLILHISEISELEPLVSDFPENAQALAEAFLPGALTLILPKSGLVPYETTGGLETVAIRMPENKIARTLIKASGVPIAAPSANVSGKPSATKASHVLYDFNGKIPMIIDGGSAKYGLESTIIDMTANPPAILRPGFVTFSEISEVLGTVQWGNGVFESLSSNDKPVAPGTKYKHYAPLASVTVFEGDCIKAALEIKRRCTNEKNTGIIASEQTAEIYGGTDAHVISAGDRNNPETIGANLFKILRKLDYIGVSQIYSESFASESVGGSEIGDAIMNRLKKAAGYRIEYV